MKTVYIAVLSLSLSACDAFDASRLAHLQSFSQSPDASANEPEAPEPTLDAAVLPDVSQPFEPPATNDAATPDDEDDIIGKPEVTCGDEDGGAAEDSDGDGVLDCADDCPLDPDKTSRGLCGCGHPDDDVGGVVSCRGLLSALAHRFRFQGTGTTLLDDRGGAAGTIRNTELTGDGSLALAGGASSQFVDLPDGLISGFVNVTVEVWVTWTGTESFQRIFDFGDNDSGVEGDNGLGSSYLMLSPRIWDRGFGASYANAGPESAVFVEASDPLPVGTQEHVAVVLDDSKDQLRIYRNGKLAGSALVTGSLAEVRDTSNWLGRSQFKTDTAFSGALHELRIYRSALSDAQLMLSYASGPDPAFLED